MPTRRLLRWLEDERHRQKLSRRFVTGYTNTDDHPEGA